MKTEVFCGAVQPMYDATKKGFYDESGGIRESAKYWDRGTIERDFKNGDLLEEFSARWEYEPAPMHCGDNWSVIVSDNPEWVETTQVEEQENVRSGGGAESGRMRPPHDELDDEWNALSSVVR